MAGIGSRIRSRACLDHCGVLFRSPSSRTGSSAWVLPHTRGWLQGSAWICFYVSKALVSAAALVSSSKVSLLGERGFATFGLRQPQWPQRWCTLMPLMVSYMACWFGILVAQDRQQCYDGLVLGLRVLFRCDITSLSQRDVVEILQDALALAEITPSLSGSTGLVPTTPSPLVYITAFSTQCASATPRVDRGRGDVRSLGKFVA